MHDVVILEYLGEPLIIFTFSNFNNNTHNNILQCLNILLSDVIWTLHHLGCISDAGTRSLSAGLMVVISS